MEDQYNTSDKIFWHRYRDFYLENLREVKIKEGEDILEVGVKDSESIRLWRALYPSANITGIDLKEVKDWYRDTRIQYIIGDQSDILFMKDTLSSLKNPRVLIDDGSHHPNHQLIFLDLACQEVVKRRIDCVVMIEDIHSSLQLIKGNNSIKGKIKRTINKFKTSLSCESQLYGQVSETANALSLLLCAERCKYFSIPQQKILDSILMEIDMGRRDATAIIEVISRIFTNVMIAEKIKIYQRTTLPHHCWNCNSLDIDPCSLLCKKCGQRCYSREDSMTSLISFRF